MDSIGVRLIAAERKRQIEVEGYESVDDIKQTDKQLAWAAACYAAPEPIFVRRHTDGEFVDPWPWGDPETDKRWRHNYLRRLVIAGALITAEIDRVIQSGEWDLDSGWPG